MKGYILGLNGWFDRSHDASACIIKDGKILVMAEEERFLRKKHSYDKLPHCSTLWCLNKLGIGLDDISSVAIGWDYKELYRRAKIIGPKIEDLADLYFPKKYFDYKKKPKIQLVPHHLAHAASSFFLSGMEKSSILIVDGQGEDSSTTFALGEGNKIKILWTLPIEYSLGYFYEAISDFIGLGLHAPGKTMGLAPYGKPKYKFEQFKLNDNGYRLNLKFLKNSESLDQQLRVVSSWREEFIKKFGNIENYDYIFRESYGDIYKNTKLSKIEKDIAASAQKTLEDVLLHCAKVLIGKTGVKNICMSGGVALNCSSNTKILNSKDVANVFIPPFTNDAGVSVGAALLIGGVKSKLQLSHAYFGPSYKDEEIKEILDQLKIKYKFCGDKIVKEVAEIIKDGKIVSWFQGSSEIGPRALGNRSILANPSLEEMHKKVNLAKNREQWRPLAPSILEEDIDDFLENAKKSPFMLYTFSVKKNKQKKVPAIVHVDGSTRPQTVNKSINLKFYRLIEEFKKIAGIPLVMNTSFNGAKEAIVSSPIDAISSFYSNSTDYLAIGNFLIKK